MKINKILQVIYKPHETIKDNLKSYHLLIPFLFLAIVSSILNIVYALLSINYINIEVINIQSITPVLIVSSLIIGFLSPLFSIVINSTINYITILVTGVYVEFKSLMVIGVFAYIPVIIEVILKIVFTLLTRDYTSFTLFTTLTVFFNPSSLLQSIFVSLSITGIWSLFIYVLGVQILIKEKYGKAKTITILVVIIVNIFLTVAFGILQTIIGT